MKYIVENEINLIKEICNTLYYIANENMINSEMRKNFKVVNFDQYCDNELKHLMDFIYNFKKRNTIPLDRICKYFSNIEADQNYEEILYIAGLIFDGMTLEDINKAKTTIEKLEEDQLRIYTIKEIIESFEANNNALEIDELDKDDNLMDTFISYVDSVSIKESAKWNLFLICQHPRKYLLELIEIIIDSVDNFNKSFVVLNKDFLKVKNELQEKINDNNNYISDITGIKGIDVWGTSIKVYISMIRFSNVTIRTVSGNKIISKTEKSDYIYFGWKFMELMKISKEKNGERELLLDRFKCLSDKSKFKILTLLKKRPMYGQEIASEMNLTTATVSYHMNALVLTEFVLIQRIDNKIFYSVNSIKIEEFINVFKRELL